MLSLMLACATAVTVGDDPMVEVVETRGRVDGPAAGPAGSPRWDRIELDLTLVNRLEHRVGDFRIEVELVRPRPVPTAIPGWSFVVERPELWLEAGARQTVRIEEVLPERREALAAPDINFRVRLRRYRVEAPDLGVAVKLLGSASESDQRAALESFEADRLTRTEREAAVERLARALDRLPRWPSASDALRLLFVLRALGRLGASEQIPRILTLPDHLDDEVWGRAVVDLSSRVLAVQATDEPRLEVLPSWARQESALLAMKAKDAVPEAVRDAVLRMGDAAVPGLMRVVHDEREPALRERAWRLLVALGRPTVRSQLRLAERGPELEAIEAAGELRLEDAAVPLVELLDHTSALVRQASADALTQLGGSAIPALLDRLGRPGDEAATRLVARILRRPGGPRAGASAGRVRAEVARTREARRATHESEVQARIDAALDLGRSGDRRVALRALDAVRADDPEIYRRSADRIAELYADHARSLLEAANYDAALAAAREGASVRATAPLRRIEHEARVALVQGYLRLGEWSLASRLLEKRPADETSRGLTIEVSAGKVREALSSGNRGLARAILDRARLDAPDHPTLRALHRRMLWLENLPTALAVFLGGGAVITAVIVTLRRRLEQWRLARLEAALDRR